MLPLPQERLELDPITFLNAPENFHPIPFMVDGARTNTTCTWVTLVKNQMKHILMTCSFKVVDSCGKEIERDMFLALKLEQKLNGNLKAKRGEEVSG